LSLILAGTETGPYDVVMNNCCLISVILLLLCACDSATDTSRTTLSTLSGPDIQRLREPDLILRGQVLFKRHCSTCHGDHAQGAPNWRHRLADGTYPPPPLNGSGHAWHHPVDKLRLMILDGSQPSGDGEPVGHMPPWRDTLSIHDIDAIIAWFQSLWPDPVYAIWYEQQVRARGQE
jgi:mono/diheme cytochrome c family protein